MPRPSTARRSRNWPPAPLSVVGTTWSWSVKAASAKPSQRNTPLVTEVCEGQVTVTDPCHPLFGRTFPLAGIAYLPGHVRHCQVEICPGQFAFIPVRSTNLSPEPHPEPTALTATAIAELVATFQAEVAGTQTRRNNHAQRHQSAGVGGTDRQATRCHHRSHRRRAHGGGGE